MQIEIGRAEYARVGARCKRYGTQLTLQNVHAPELAV